MFNIFDISSELVVDQRVPISLLFFFQPEKIFARVAPSISWRRWAPASNRPRTFCTDVRLAWRPSAGLYASWCARRTKAVSWTSPSRRRPKKVGVHGRGSGGSCRWGREGGVMVIHLKDQDSRGTPRCEHFKF